MTSEPVAKPEPPLHALTAATQAPQQAPTVEPPKHPVHALATFELVDYRRQLERAIAYFDRGNPVPPVRVVLQARLDVVLAEQDERVRMAASA
ncbi:MAG: hypothetical protein M3Z75_28060 [Actinomycetota bacterium]|nr:hypothetical protein [Actinomycetota bacterium]